MLLVTGGAGFIGSHVVQAALDAGHAVRVLDRADTHVDPRADLVLGDVRDPDALERALERVEEVSHQAAMVGLGTDISDIADYASHNDLGTAMLLRALARRPVRRLVLASSMVVYGEGRYRCATHGTVRPAPRRRADLEAGRFDPPCPHCGAPLTPEAIAEDAPLDPRNVYAATKLHQEHLATAFGRETGVPVTALRYHNVYGPRMPRDTPYAGVAALFASALAAGRRPQVFEDGRQLRDFVHVRDVARANVLALGAPPGTYNVCSGTPRSIGELAAALANGGPQPEVTGGYRLGDVRHVFADSEHARDTLGFTAGEDFATTVAELSAAQPR
jgi:dTDP-L-rhamnose 4-epimerase